MTSKVLVSTQPFYERTCASGTRIGRECELSNRPSNTRQGRPPLDVRCHYCVVGGNAKGAQAACVERSNRQLWLVLQKNGATPAKCFPIFRSASPGARRVVAEEWAALNSPSLTAKAVSRAPNRSWPRRGEVRLLPNVVQSHSAYSQASIGTKWNTSTGVILPGSDESPSHTEPRRWSWSTLPPIERRICPAT